MARVQSFAQQIAIMRQATLEQTQALIVRTAKTEHAKVMRAAPRPVAFRRFVDGKEGAEEEAVRPNGVIVYRYGRLDVVVQFALETLFELSPVDSGDYRKAHQLFLDGRPADSLKDFRPGAEIVIANFLPYSRKIEMGKMTMRVPGTDRVYQQAEQLARRRYGSLARIVFTYRGVIAGALTGGKAGGKSENRFPALLIAEK